VVCVTPQKQLRLPLQDDLLYDARMLYSVPDMKRIDYVPHAADYWRWREALDRLNPRAYTAIHHELDGRFDSREVDTSSWIPGSDWTGTVYQPIYDACGLDEDAAARFFGLLVWQVVMDHDGCWSFGRYEKEGVPIKGMTYFRIECP
jgi:hypothetical protein